MGSGHDLVKKKLQSAKLESLDIVSVHQYPRSLDQASVIADIKGRDPRDATLLILGKRKERKKNREKRKATKASKTKPASTTPLAQGLDSSLLSGHLINNLADTCSTLDQHLHHQPVESWPIFTVMSSSVARYM